MSNAFRVALRTLLRDPNLGVDAEYRAGGAGPAVAVRVIVSQPDEITTAFEAQHVRPTRVLTAAVADLPNLRAGDTFTLGADLLTAHAPQRDATGTTWTIPCR